MDALPKKPVKKLLFIVLSVLLIIVLGVGLFIYRNRGTQPVVEQAFETFGPVTVVPEVQTPDTAGPAPTAVDICGENREKLQGLFAYLDRQDYIASRKLKGGASQHFRELLARLLKRPPFVQREADTLLRVLQNKAHFYRVLGKRDTLLLRDILRKEDSVLESFSGILYQAMALQETCKADAPALPATLEKVYPYAVFFLNTLGGSSYLMRRNSRLRLLTRYYSILVLDQANRQKLNRLGLDIRPPLDVLLEDIKGSANLTGKEEYIETLKSIRAEF